MFCLAFIDKYYLIAINMIDESGKKLLTENANTCQTLTRSFPYTKLAPCLANAKKIAALLPRHSNRFRPNSIRMQNMPNKNCRIVPVMTGRHLIYEEWIFFHYLI